jgi:hypothetical protein
MDPEGILAAADADLPAVTTHLSERLSSDDEQQRADAADAARLLLVIDPRRIVALGPPLVTSIRSKDVSYAGEPHATAAATRALAEAWRGDPETTVIIIETNGVTLPAPAREELVGTVFFLRRRREPLDLSTEAAQAAVAFCLRRMSGDWGVEAADRATDELKTLAQETTELVIPCIDALIGQMLELCVEPLNSPLVEQPRTVHQTQMLALNRYSQSATRSHRMRTVAEIMGLLVRANLALIDSRIEPFFSTESGDEDQDRQVRKLLLITLKDAASAESLRDLLP